MLDETDRILSPSRPIIHYRASDQAVSETEPPNQHPTTVKSSAITMFAPAARVLRAVRLQTSANGSSYPNNPIASLIAHVIAGLKRLDTSLDPSKTIHRLRNFQFTIYNTALWIALIVLACGNLYIMDSRALKVLIPVAYTLAVLIPATSQFFFPATPVLMWVMTFFCARYIPSSWRPGIHVVLLPTLESVLYGANISDLLTRFTHPILDILAWVPYGIGHFAIPGILALVLWAFGPKGSPQFFGKAFGFMNLTGVLCQLFFPCAAPCEPYISHHNMLDVLTLRTGYEIIHGLVPANYSMPGSPGGLMRIDRIFGTAGYTNTFGSAPLVFGAFPSLHSGCATIEALFLTHFFPKYRYGYWGYVGVLYWSTMYLTHHYLIDVVGGGCLALASFFYFMPKEFKDMEAGIQWDALDRVGGSSANPEAYQQLEAEDDEPDLDEEIRKLDNRATLDAIDPVDSLPDSSRVKP